ncbi:Fe-S cluster assembly protein SufD [Azospirillum picis]|uniref:Fe-S cluster assembly protein SufD n=1 Tax=Azospirillum picis TaxID=488438 RepID=A0ABU0MSY1_9PROT|nr:Fe-S cluster assembly protein SufD [Azospirillum picis]MBP2302892.1 Fe-S cluster assembly protein SufD [Azospirillum picis]MDQ0536603.1 Fe-S cluster assembly protein SufD [Azospirillum picis]
MSNPSPLQPMTYSTRGADPATAPGFLAPLDALPGGLPGAGLPWLDDLRSAGRERFAAVGLPTIRNESWRYTNLRDLGKVGFEPAGASAAAIDLLPTVRAAGESGPRLVFVDGRFRADLSATAGLPAGVELLGLADAFASHGELLAAHLGRLAAADDRPLVALNSAYLADGPLLRVPAGVQVDQPVELVFVSVGTEGAATARHPRSLLIVEAGARAVVVEHHVGQGAGTTLANHVTEVFVGEGATLHHYKAQREGAAAVHLAHIAATVATGGCYDNYILTTGGRLSRNEVVSRLDGTEARTHVSGGYLVRGNQHVDTTTVIVHAQPNGTSREVYKGVIGDSARAVFQGKITVCPGAQKTDGYQLNRALLLSDTAEIDSKPELEIHADDVKCSHGCTAGELDDDALFYLRARGIDRDTAQGLLIGAFLAESLEEIAEESIRDAFQRIVSGWLEEQK